MDIPKNTPLLCLGYWSWPGFEHNNKLEWRVAEYVENPCFYEGSDVDEYLWATIINIPEQELGTVVRWRTLDGL